MKNEAELGIGTNCSNPLNLRAFAMLHNAWQAGFPHVEDVKKDSTITDQPHRKAERMPAAGTTRATDNVRYQRYRQTREQEQRAYPTDQPPKW